MRGDMKLVVTLLPVVLLAIAVGQFVKTKRTAYGHNTAARDSARISVLALSAAAVILAASALLVK